MIISLCGAIIWDCTLYATVVYPGIVGKAQHLSVLSLVIWCVSCGDVDLTNVLFLTDGKVLSFPVSKVDNVVDTNGAGDAFVGGEFGIFMFSSARNPGTSDYNN